MSQLRDDFFQLASKGIPPSEETAERLTIALEDFLQFWRTETLPFIEAGGSELRFLEAPYGRGKTHCLYLMARNARQNGFATALVSCSLDCKPFESIADTYRFIAQSLRFPGENGADGNDLLDFLRSLPPEHLRALRDAETLNLGFRNVLAEFAQYSQRPNTIRPILEALEGLIRAPLGGRVSLRDLYRYDHRLARPLGKLTKRTALAWLHGILRLPQQVSLKGAVILFDETGADFHLRRESTEVQRHHLANLRNLVDNLGIGRLPGCSITYAVAADLLQQAKDVLEPLHQRIARTQADRRNPRAICCRLDELTKPGTHDRQFFLSLGKRLVELGREAGFLETGLLKVESMLPVEAARAAASINNAAVREFIKLIATTITD